MWIVFRIRRGRPKHQGPGQIRKPALRRRSQQATCVPWALTPNVPRQNKAGQVFGHLEMTLKFPESTRGIFKCTFCSSDLEP